MCLNAAMMELQQLTKWPEPENRVLGRGSFGEVVRALYCGSPVAVKELLTGKNQMPELRKEARQELKKEVAVLQKFRHPNVVCMIAYNDKYIVMDMYKGNARKINSLEEVAVVGRDCMRGLAYMHLHGTCVLHGDIKPDNILVNHDANGNIIKAALGDVGLARSCANAMKNKGFSGTPGYTPMPNPTVDSTHDVFSLAVSLLDAFMEDDVHTNNDEFGLDDNTLVYVAQLADPAYQKVVSDMLSVYHMDKNRPKSPAQRGKWLRDLIFQWENIVETRDITNAPKISSHRPDVSIL